VGNVHATFFTIQETDAFPVSETQIWLASQAGKDRMVHF